MRTPRVLLLVAAIGALFCGLLFAGGQVASCLGPLNVTTVQCIAAFNAAYDPDYAPGPGPGAWIAAALALALVAGAIAPWRRPSRPSLLGLATAVAAGAILGAVAYELMRETSLTGPTSTGAVITVAFGANPDARLMAAAIGGGSALVAGVSMLRWGPRPRSNSPDISPSPDRSTGAGHSVTLPPGADRAASPIRKRE